MQSDPTHNPDTTADAPLTDETAKLLELQANVRNQDDLERELGRQADQLLLEQADERDQKRIDRTTKEKLKLEDQTVKLYHRLEQRMGPSQRVRIESEIAKAQDQLSSLENDLKEIQERIDERHGVQDDTPAADSGRLLNESRRDYLIRTGKITPFSKMGTGPKEGPLASLHDALIDAEDERDEAEALQDASRRAGVSHRELRLPGIDLSDVSGDVEEPDRSRKRRKIAPDRHQKRDRPSRQIKTEDDDSYVESEEDVSSTDEFDPTPAEVRKETSRAADRDDVEDLRGLDDGNEEFYQARLKRWIRRRAAARKRRDNTDADMDIPEQDTEHTGRDEPTEEWLLPHPTIPDAEYDGGYRIPGDIFPILFDYQKTGVQWLWELYQQQVGGIIGDEMGLGKTIQVISFLAGLHHSGKLRKPVIVVAPATVMKQWVTEFHRWWPPFRVSILHTSGSGMINVRSESNRENALNNEMWDPSRPYTMTKAQKMAKKIVKRVVEEGHVLVTTYSGLQTYAPVLIPVDWDCAILDEGHKIRNPNTSITIHCKELRTPHRLILSGTPMQNNLSELWSLFDFVFPMRLGTLVDFRNQFEYPIRQGGYANASNLQVQTAARCAETLKDAISPYLLQRFKVDVASDLPKKSEQVLFCKLTPIQRKAYEQFLNSGECNSILDGRRQVLYGVDMLRKICNHPDLITHKLFSTKAGYGDPSKSGKMQVVKALLELWKDTGHKTLLFAQHRIMLDILEKFIKALPGFNYRRMDGDTPIARRQLLVDEFNNSPDLHVFLLTTKVGGLGVNLTGADRVLIYDPDWNPSTDMQARERAWRLGQKREVTIYRLMTAGTIEEKIYHRQIFKQFLTNKVLKDPKQRQTFEMSNLHDLFSLGEEGQTETSSMFKTEVTYQEGGDSKTKAETAKPSSSELQDDGREIQKVEGIAAVEHFHNDAEEVKDEGEGTNTPGASNSEARLMETIFAQSGVHSALEHDRIVNGKKIIAPDRSIIEAEAKRLAAEAAEKLRKAEQTARSVPVGTPTWTGQFGIAGRPEERPRSAFGGAASTVRGAAAGPSSASILANLANRTGSTTSRTSSPRDSPAPGGRVDFISMIRDYMVAQGGSTYTQMLIDHFNRYCTTPQRSAEFKETLKKVAVLEKGGRNGRGKWSLKKEYAKR